MSTDKKIEDLIRKIRALRAKAEDPATTEAEAASFAAKAAELLAAHGLEEAQLRQEDQSGVTHVEERGDWVASPARRVLMLAVCQLYMVRPIMSAKDPWILIGRKHNIVMAMETCSYLIGTTKRLSSEWRRANRGGNHIDFRRGCFERLAERVREMKKAEEPKWTATGNPGNLPALYVQERQLTAAYRDQRWKTSRRRPIGVRVGDAGMQGRRAAEGVGLSRQVSGGKSGALLLGKG